MMEKQLHKVLNFLVKEKFPMIEEIIVNTEDGEKNYFKVGVGIPREALEKYYPEVTKNKITDHVKQSSLYALGSSFGKVYWVYFFDPSNKN
jgi:hypothetical protein